MLNAILAIPDDKPQVADASPAPSAEDLRRECAERAAIYRLLAGVFVEEPGAPFLAALRHEKALRSLAEAGLRFDGDFTDADEATLLDRLSCEYTTLFAASGGFPPVESVRLTGRYQQQPHFDVSQTYRRLGFVLSKGKFEVFPDQLGIELMFVAELLERGAEALTRGEPNEHRRLEREIKRFWTLHLGKWVRGYCTLVERAAEHSLYREMARFLRGFAEEEIAAMGLRIEDTDQGQAVVPKAEIKLEFNPDEPVCNGCGVQPDGVQRGRADTVHTLHDLR